MRNILKKLAKILEIGTKVEAPSRKIVPISAMEDVEFWYVIDRCNHLTGSNEQYYNLLWSMLSEMDAVSVARFAVKVEQSRQLLQTWNASAAARLIIPGLPKDAFHGFQNWAISAGKEAFLGAVKYEDNIADVLRVAGHRDLGFESFHKIPAEVLSQKPESGQSDLALERDPDQATLKGEHWELTEANLTRRFPKLSAMLGRTLETEGKPPLPTVH